MGAIVEPPSFDDWVAWVFSHDPEIPVWDPPDWDVPPSTSLSYMTRLFLSADDYLAKYNDAQVGEGLHYILDSGSSDHMLALTDARTALSDCIACVNAFYPLFRKLFAKRCSDHLTHLTSSGNGQLNGVCYMWWDVIPLTPQPLNPSEREIDWAALGVMEKTLSIDSVACRESALHGLGHWWRCYPEPVRAIVDRAMSVASGWPSELTAYARQARIGCVL